MEQWPEVTTGGVLALLIIREVLGFLKTKSGPNGPNGNGVVSLQVKELRTMAEQIQKLYDWHDQRDEDGVPIWYVRKSLERHIGQLTETLRTLTQEIKTSNKKEK